MSNNSSHDLGNSSSSPSDEHDAVSRPKRYKRALYKEYQNHEVCLQTFRKWELLSQPKTQLSKYRVRLLNNKNTY